MLAEQAVYEFLHENLIDVPEAENTPVSNSGTEAVDQVEPIPTTSFEDLIKTYKESLYVSKNFQQTLAVMLATSVSTNIGGNELLLMYVMGPPSSGKSTLCEALSANRKYCRPTGKFTGFHSGKPGKGAKDASLIPLIQGKTMVIKDFTTILSMPITIQEGIFGELRELTDGSSTADYRNNKHTEYNNIRFSMLAGVTDAILKLDHTNLGERFLMVDITDEFHGSHEHVKMAMSSITGAMLSSFLNLPNSPSEEGIGTPKGYIPPDRLLKVKQCTSGFLNHVHHKMFHMHPPIVPDWFSTKVNSIARFVAKVRAKVTRDFRTRSITYRTRSEIGIRLAALLMKLSLSLAVVLDRDTLDKEILDIIRKVAKDTARGLNFEIVQAIADCIGDGGLGLDRGQLAKKLDLPESDVVRRIDDMRIVGLLQRVETPNTSGARGRHRHVWKINTEYMGLWKSLTSKPGLDRSSKVS